MRSSEDCDRPFSASEERKIEKRERDSSFSEEPFFSSSARRGVMPASPMWFSGGERDEWIRPLRFNFSHGRGDAAMISPSNFAPSSPNSFTTWKQRDCNTIQRHRLQGIAMLALVRLL